MAPVDGIYGLKWWPTVTSPLVVLLAYLRAKLERMPALSSIATNLAQLNSSLWHDRPKKSGER